jgi:hypothetical protein
MRSYKTFLYFLIAFVFLATCLHGQPSGWQGRTEIKRNIHYIYNPQQGLWDDDPSKKITLEKRFSIGYYEGPEDYLFTMVKEVIVDKVGRIIVLDKDCVRIFDQSGTLVLTFGSEGEGPGEFKIPQGMALDYKGNIYIYDSILHRVSVFDSAGKFIRSIRLNDRMFGKIGLKLNTDVVISRVIDFHPQKPDQFKDHKLIRLYNQKGKKLDSFFESELIVKKGPYGREEFSWCHFQLLKGDTLIGGYNYPYKIHFFDPNNRLFKVIQRESPIFSKPSLLSSQLKMMDGNIFETNALALRASIWDIFVLPDGKFFVYIKDNGPDYKEHFSKNALGSLEGTMVLDLYDKTGYFLKSYPYDNYMYGKIKLVDAEGYLYTAIGPSEIVPGVTKWKIAFE